jgi:hypothetical protein
MFQAVAEYLDPPMFQEPAEIIPAVMAVAEPGMSASAPVMAASTVGHTQELRM